MADDARTRPDAAGGDRPRDGGHGQRRREVALLADRRRAHGEVVAQLSARRDRARLGRRDVGDLVEPEGLGVAHQAPRPSFAPSGAKTELHECAKEVARLPPHASSLALRSATPDSVAAVWTG